MSNPAGENVKEAAQGFQEGIYLEKKNSTIGTGSTAKTAEYRNFWVTIAITEHTAVMALLNDDFRPTPIKETFSLETLRGPQWFFVAEGQKRYDRLRPHLDRMFIQPAQAASQPQPAPKGAAAPKSSPAKKGGWWEG